jgi:hypothetical protein
MPCKLECSLLYFATYGPVLPLFIFCIGVTILIIIGGPPFQFVYHMKIYIIELLRGALNSLHLGVADVLFLEVSFNDMRLPLTASKIASGVGNHPELGLRPPPTHRIAFDILV